MAAPSIRILYIGNSFTTRNDLPGVVGELAKCAGITVEQEVISAGGASLRRHFNAGATAKISGGRWDYVVLQEQSTLPIKVEFGMTFVIIGLILIVGAAAIWRQSFTANRRKRRSEVVPGHAGLYD